MSLVEHFAGHALSGILANDYLLDRIAFEAGHDPYDCGDKLPLSKVYELAARQAFEVAQAMVAELQRREAAVGV